MRSEHYSRRSWLRIFFVGGMTSYRALFTWIRPGILVPALIVQPVFQVAMFVYLGRSAHLETDSFYVLGDALQFAAIPCLFAMGTTIADERLQHTLSLLLVTPAPRLPLFLGRAVPVIANGFLSSLVAVALASAIFGVHIPGRAMLPLALTIAVASASCTGLGLVNAAIGLRVRETDVTSNVIFGVLLLFCGVNVPLAQLPAWMHSIATFLPLTHGIAAARLLVSGAGVADVAGLLVLEVVVGLSYMAVGLGLLRWLEHSGRRTASLERA